MLRLRIIDRISELESRTLEWRALLTRASNAQPVLTPLWLLAWWREFGWTSELRAVAVEDGDELVGLVPLAWRRAVHGGSIPVRRLELLGTGEQEQDEICSDYVGALVVRGREKDVAVAFAAGLRDGALGAWDELRMTAMSGDDPFVPILVQSLTARGIATRLERSGLCPYVPLPGTWDEYLGALGGERRYLVNRSLRELEKWAGGEWKLHRARTAEELTEGKRILEELHAARWAPAGRSGVFASERFSRFHSEIMPRLLAGEDGTGLELAWLTTRGHPVAVVYNIVYGNKVYFYQSGRLVDLPRSLRPGIVIHALSIRDSIEKGRREYDFLAGASRYKRDLALTARSIVSVRAVSPSLRGMLIEAARAFADRTRKRLAPSRAGGDPFVQGRAPE